MITSAANQQMKRIMLLNRKAKARYAQQAFVAEGLKMCLEAPRERIQAMYVSESFVSEEGKRAKLSGYSYEVVSDPVFRAVSDTETPQGILCLVQMPQYSLEGLLGARAEGTGHGAGGFRNQKGQAGDGLGSLPGGPSKELDVPEFIKERTDTQKLKNAHLLILEGIQDPGNLGTMIRTGEGAGVTGIIMDKSTVDIFHPKVIRSTMGSLYRMPFYVASDLPDAIRRLKGWGVTLYAAHIKGSMAYDQPDYTGPTGFLVGNEGNGLSPQIAGLADAYIKIPMEGSVESLNAAVAAALLMYEASRQRR